MARGDALLLLVVARADIVHVAPVVALLLSLSWPGLLGWLAVRTAKYHIRTHAACGTGGKEPPNGLRWASGQGQVSVTVRVPSPMYAMPNARAGVA